MAIIIPFKGKNHRYNLRMRFIRTRFLGFAEHEILELLLTYAIPRKDVKPIAKNLLNVSTDLHGVLNIESGVLQKFKGVGPATASFISFVCIAIHFYIKQWPIIPFEEPFSKRGELCYFFRTHLPKDLKENIIILHLTSDLAAASQPIEAFRFSDAKNARILMRSIATSALKRNSHAVAIFRRSSLTDLTPLEHDDRLVSMLQTLLASLDVRFIDYFITDESRYYSFGTHEEILF
jgi:DNA repair protein RadC